MFIDRKEIGGAGAFDHLDDDELSKTIEALAEEVQEFEQALPPPKPKKRNQQAVGVLCVVAPLAVTRSLQVHANVIASGP